MTTIDQLNPKLNDTVNVYVDSLGVVHYATSTVISGTVIGIYDNRAGHSSKAYLLGWKPGSLSVPKNAQTPLPGSLISNNHNTYVSNVSIYDSIYWVPSNFEVFIPQVFPVAAATHNAAGVRKGPQSLCTQCKVTHTMAPSGVCSYCAKAISSQAITQPSMQAASIPTPDYAAIRAAQAVKEKPCRNSTCGKMNDVGVNKCWFCECPNPAQ